MQSISCADHIDTATTVMALLVGLQVRLLLAKKVTVLFAPIGKIAYGVG